MIRSLRRIPMKWVAFVLLIAQTVLVLAALRASRTAGEEANSYTMSTAVVLCEVLKLVISTFLLNREHESWKATWFTIKKEVTHNRWNNLKVGIPSLLYTIQNNLLFEALNNLTAPTYQVTYQLKIVTTAFISVLMLGKVYSVQQWLSICVLTLGVIIIQHKPDSADSTKTNSIYGILCVLSACITSGLAGVTLEYLLKNTKTSIWMRNIQLSVVGILMGLIICFKDSRVIYEKGFLYGYTPLVWVTIFLHGGGGLVVAMVLKYADNILKCFANTVAIVFNVLVSWLLMNDFTPTIGFYIGTTMVCFALYTYSIPESVDQMKNAWLTVCKYVLALAYGNTLNLKDAAADISRIETNASTPEIHHVELNAVAAN